MKRPAWAPPGIDLDQPSIARVYDYFLGGFHNFAADRAVVEQTLKVIPESPLIAQANRGFLARAVRFCVEAGITQFLDVGSGIPTVGNVHEIAQQANPDSRVVYVDIDPVAVAHSQVILAGNEQAAVIQADLREPDRLLSDPQLREMLDLSQPIALFMVAVLHFVPDAEDPAGIIDRFSQAVAPGSHLVISHAADAGINRSVIAEFRELYEKAVARIVFRTQAEVEKLFGKFDLVEPGVVAMAEWRPEPYGQATSVYGYAGVGRKP